MEDASVLRLALRGIPACAAAGLAIGGLEALPLALAVKVELSVAQQAAATLLAGGLYAVLGAAFGGVVGLVVHPLMRRIVVARGLAAQLALAAGALLLLLFTGFAEEAADDGRGAVAIVLLGLPLFFVGALFLLASRLYRDPSARASWIAGGVGAGAFVLLLLGGVGLRASGPAVGQALPSDPRVLVLLVEGLRTDRGAAPTPSLDRLAASGVAFTGAVTPSPEPAAAFASLQTGLSPLRHEVLVPGDRLRRVDALLSATFRAEGYATAAFVSSADLAGRSGFDHGFDVYDDDRLPGPAAFGRIRPIGLAARLAGLLPAERADARTVDRFLGWLDGVTARPFFAIVHLRGPQAPYVPHGLPGFEANGPPDQPTFDHAAAGPGPFTAEADQRALRRLYREEVAALDAQIGRILDAIDGHGLADRTLVVVVGTGGQVLGEHDGVFSGRGLYDATVRVPLVLARPSDPGGTTVDVDVRTLDLYETLLEHAELRARHESEAISLIGYLDGKRDRPLPTAILGRDPDGAWAVGARNNGVKYTVRLVDGEERMFDLDEDPGETTDIRESMPETLDQARRLVHPDRVRLTELLRTGGRLTAE